MRIPILYTYRRCPYAIRARMALTVSSLGYESREISFKQKPAEMLIASPKGTVPVLVLEDDTVIDQSYEIMKWALRKNDPLGWLPQCDEEWKATDALVGENDTSFKTHLDAYKYNDRHPDVPMDELRERAMPFLRRLDATLARENYLFRGQCTIADVALFPFIRQLRNVDSKWFDSNGLEALNAWLHRFLEGELFAKVMAK